MARSSLATRIKTFSAAVALTFLVFGLIVAGVLVQRSQNNRPRAYNISCNKPFHTPGSGPCTPYVDTVENFEQCSGTAAIYSVQYCDYYEHWSTATYGINSHTSGNDDCNFSVQCQGSATCNCVGQNVNNQTVTSNVCNSTLCGVGNVLYICGPSGYGPTGQTCSVTNPVPSPTPVPTPSSPIGACGSCNSCGDSRPNACALLGNPPSCSKAGYCPPGGQPTANSQGAAVFCQDGSGPMYWLPGLTIVVDQDGAATLKQKTGSDGRTFFAYLNKGSYYHAHIDGVPMYLSNGGATTSTILTTFHPLAAAYSNLTIAATGQSYGKLTLNTATNSMVGPVRCHDPKWYDPFVSNFCTPVTDSGLPGLTSPEVSTSYSFGVPSYGEALYDMVWRFSNCGGAH